MGNKLLNTMIAVVIIALLLVISYAGVAGITWVVCKCFELTFTFKAAFGVWLILTIIGWQIKE